MGIATNRNWTSPAGGSIAAPLAAWLRGLSPRPRQRATDWIAWAIDTGRLIDHWPTRQQPLVLNWLGPRWYFFAPEPPPVEKRTVWLASSRWGRKPDQWIPLAQRLAAALHDHLHEHDLPLTAAGTTCHRLVRRWCWRERRACVELMLPKAARSFERWLDRVSAIHPTGVSAASDEQDANFELYRVHVSPVAPTIAPNAPPANTATTSPMMRAAAADDDEHTAIPERDLLLGAAADRVVVVHQRAGGATATIATARRDQQALHPGSTIRVARLPREIGRVAHGPLVISPPATALNNAGSTIASVTSGDFLLHWTRTCQGAWPDQSEENFLDEMLSGRIAARDPLSVLARIAATQRLIGTGWAIRGGHAVVCFTSMDLGELRSHRAYRSHRGRWDAEPYGIAIDRTWLIGRGARPVIYGDHQQWLRLPDEDRPYFQLVGTTSIRGNAVDWSSEQEWRVVGDINLGAVPKSKAFFFVRSPDEAEQLQGVSKWPVIWMDG